MQAELTLLGYVSSEMRRVDAELVAMCDTEQAAFRLCRRESQVHYTDSVLAHRLGTTPGTLNTMLNADHNKRPRWMSRKMQIELQQLCGNTAIDQWADLCSQGMLNCQRTKVDRKVELLRELAALEAVE